MKGIDLQKLLSVQFGEQSDRNTVFRLCLHTGIERKASSLINKGDFVVARFILEKNHWLYLCQYNIIF